MINNIQNTSFKRYTPKQSTTTFGTRTVSSGNTKLKAAIGATMGAAIPIAAMLKTQKTANPLKLEYGLKDMLILSASSITGGTFGGMHNENKEAKKNKLKEGVFQLLNAGLPAISVAGLLKLCEKQKRLNCTPCKILAVAAGIGLGMFAAIKSANKIFDPKDKHPDRKLGPKDFIASADDAIGALALAKLPVIQTLCLDKALPLVFGYCGYRAGKAE